MSELSPNYVRKTLRHYYPTSCGERRLGVYVIFKRKSTLGVTLRLSPVPFQIVKERSTAMCGSASFSVCLKGKSIKKLQLSRPPTRDEVISYLLLCSIHYLKPIVKTLIYQLSENFCSSETHQS